MEYLTIACIASVLIILVGFCRRPQRSRYGDLVIADLKRRHQGSQRLGVVKTSLPTDEILTGVALFGLGSLAGTRYQGLRRDLQPAGGSSTCGGGGSSCGSSGGGDGGGGCGGGGCGGCGGGD